MNHADDKVTDLMEALELSVLRAKNDRLSRRIEALEKAGTAMVNAESAVAYCAAENAWAKLVGWTEDGAS